MQMLGLAPKPKTQTPPPAQRWRNYYRVYHVLELRGLGIIFPGVHGGPDAFPSQEIAEQHGARFVNAINPPGRYFLEFAGAFPEGGDAN